MIPSRASAVGGLGWATLAGLALCGVAGAAAEPHGWLLGIPSLSVCAVVASLVLLAARVSGVAAGAPGLGFLPVLVLVLAGVPLPGLFALTGGQALALALAGLAAVVSRAGVRPPWWLLPCLALLVHFGVALRVQQQVGPEGDEPHYLMVADSLLRDHDVSLAQDYAAQRYRSFYPRPLEPHFRVRGRGGEIYSLHALGLSLVVLPAYALGGYPLVSLFMALLATLLVCAVRDLVRHWLSDPALAEAAGWLVALGPPLVHYAGLVFTEVPAALLVCIALRLGSDREPSRRRALAWGLAVAFLPWLNVRYAILAALLAGYRLVYRPRNRDWPWLVLPGIVSLLAIGAYHHALYGFFDPRRVYGTRREFALGVVPEGLPGLLLDQEFGLLVYAPVFTLAGLGLWRLRGRPRESLVCAALVASVLAVASAWPMWRGGWNPPARFLVPVLPALMVLTAAGLRGRLRAGPALLVGWGLWAGLAGGAEPRLVHRDRDGTAPLWRQTSGAVEWTRLLPGYVLADPDRHRLAAVWVGALVLAASAPGLASARNLGLAAAGLVAAATAADGLSQGRAGGREAVHVIGQPALRVPGWSVVAGEGRWGPGELGWGPVYEPHRFPEGAVFGSRLPLVPGCYRVEVDAEVLGDGVPWVRLRPEPGRVRLARLAGTPLQAQFEIAAGEHAVTLALEGGGPLTLRGVRLVRDTTATR